MIVSGCPAAFDAVPLAFAIEGSCAGRGRHTPGPARKRVWKWSTRFDALTTQLSRHRARWIAFRPRFLTTRNRNRLAIENRGKETILESDLLSADAQLLKTQNAISDASDRVASASEKLNDLMGRDIHTQFRVARDSATQNRNSRRLKPLEARALQNRPELKKAKLQVQQADYDARAKKAEYIPDVSLAFNYFTTANFANALPSNIATAGLQLTLGTVGLGAQAPGIRRKASERRASQSCGRRDGARRSSGSEKCVAAVGEHAAGNWR